ncbi:hypothetical protein WN55_02702 [Dufourea novaeangliae]|uniref:Uncharacterized protein n=1 Tax=Dufourea novaeangliae TaxID=178035 RepID=A0A154NXN5_DUFNO|nr:hypothetical protein WN55_02702 [Dufourea novaeangliae]
MVVEADNETALRSKRTIGILRELFPEASQMIEQKVNAIVAEVIRVLGPTLLRNFLGNNGQSAAGGGGTGSSDGSTATAASPFDDEDEDTGVSGFKSTSSNGSKVSIALPTFPPDEDVEDVETTANDSSTTTMDVNPEAEDRANEVAAESQNNEVKVQFADEQPSDEAAPLTPLDEVEAEDDENRNKRFLNFGFGGAAGTSGGSGAGSGNFLFDIIRQAADGAARAAGTVYRVVAGTQSLGLGLSASRDLGPAPQDAAPAAAPAGSSATAGSSSNTQAASGAGNLPPLVAGSGGQASAGGIAGKTEEVAEAVPGPVTRLFVIANRGISNLIQDLILVSNLHDMLMWDIWGR